MSRKKNTYTIYDIAKISGFSPKTVSRVINQEESVKQETRQIIEAVIAKLAYAPNIYAKNLSKKSSVNILISVKKKEAFPLIWFQTLLDKLLIACKNAGINAVIEYYGKEDKISDSIIGTSGGFIDGVVIFYEGKNDARLNYLMKHKIPCIVFGKGFQDDIIYVSNDDYNAMYQLVETFSMPHLKRIWLLMGGENSVNKERVRGVKDALGLQLEKSCLTVKYGLSTIESVYAYASEHLQKGNLPDLIFVSGDEKVQGLIKACHEKEIAIPDDLSIIGFDNIPISQYYTPPLTTISPDYTELSKQIISLLMNKIQGVSVSSVEVPTHLIVRESTKPTNEVGKKFNPKPKK